MSETVQLVLLHTTMDPVSVLVLHHFMLKTVQPFQENVFLNAQIQNSETQPQEPVLFNVRLGILEISQGMEL